MKKKRTLALSPSGANTVLSSLTMLHESLLTIELVWLSHSTGTVMRAVTKGS